MTKKELTKAVKSCKRVYAYCAGMTEHDGFDIQVVKADILWTLKMIDTSEWNTDWFRASFDKRNNLYIG